MERTVCVSGCWDTLHPGHLGFLRKAAAMGDRLIVFVARDATIVNLKGVRPAVPEAGRLELIQSLKIVHHAELADDVGLLDFVPNLRRIKPDIFAVNFDGDSHAKEEACTALGVRYVCTGDRSGEHSSRTIRGQSRIPYRVNLCGAWFDHPKLSSIAPGKVITVSVFSHDGYRSRCGLADSTRQVAERLWGNRIPDSDPSITAKLLFGAENPPGSKYVSGSQDAIGICLPGVNALTYSGDYWPEIEPFSPECLEWLQARLWLFPTNPRPGGWSIALPALPDTAAVCAFAAATSMAANAIEMRDEELLCEAVTSACCAQVNLIPKMRCDALDEMIARAGPKLGVGINGAGGGGYLTLISSNPPHGSIPVFIRR